MAMRPQSPTDLKDDESTTSAMTGHGSPTNVKHTQNTTSGMEGDSDSSLDDNAKSIYKPVTTVDDLRPAKINNEEKNKTVKPATQMPSILTLPTGVDVSRTMQNLMPSQDNKHTNVNPSSMSGEVVHSQSLVKDDKGSGLVLVAGSDQPSQSTDMADGGGVMNVALGIDISTTDNAFVSMQTSIGVDDGGPTSNAGKDDLLPSSTSHTDSSTSKPNQTTMGTESGGVVVSKQNDLTNIQQPNEDTNHSKGAEEDENKTVNGDGAENEDAQNVTEVSTTERPTLVMEGDHLVITYVGASIPVLPFDVPEGVTITYVERDSLPDYQTANPEQVHENELEVQQPVIPVPPSNTAAIDYESDTSGLVTDVAQ